MDKDDVRRPDKRNIYASLGSLSTTLQKDALNQTSNPPIREEKKG
jgi:hypothetical protein